MRRACNAHAHRAARHASRSAKQRDDEERAQAAERKRLDKERKRNGRSELAIELELLSLTQARRG
eukprot:1107965-Prymnesium_polylepis.1